MNIRELLDQPREVLERFCEQKTQYAYLGDGEALTRVLGKYLMYVDSLDISIAPHFIMNGYWESWITQALVKIKPGTRCVDIGANHGYFTLVLADLCGSDVFAFEPQSRLARMIKKSANVCGYQRQVTVLQKAVGAKSGKAYLKGEHNNLGGVNCHLLPDDALGGVSVVTLDEEIPGEIGFIKIDAEGFEPHIWAGMSRHLKSRPTILMEFTAGSYQDANGFLDEIEKCYPLREIDNGGDIVLVKREKLLSNPDFSMLWLEA